MPELQVVDPFTKRVRTLTVGDDVDQELVTHALKLSAGLNDSLAEAFNQTCALNKIPLIIEGTTTYGSDEIIRNHDYAHHNPKIQKIIDFLRQELLALELPVYVSRKIYRRVLSNICDTYNYTGFDTLREFIESFNEIAAEAARDQWNAGNHACSRIQKLLIAISEPCDSKPMQDLLGALVHECSKHLDITSSQAYIEACLAVNGKCGVQHEQ